MIREIQLQDKEQWEKFYRCYADFYQVDDIKERFIRIF